MKKLYLVDLDTHAIVPLTMTIETLSAVSPISATWPRLQQLNQRIIEETPPVQPVTCETCREVTCKRQTTKTHMGTEYIGLVFTDLGGCDQWEPKK